ncbi:hypothetical protein I862_07440 [endosymbiont of Acanthamoeba sp. UWC8]|uniref:hypothetical protein n=1 Tax=endosymbiont of Acanthamoeba sp. UWC8 TaxID=86106 RepID=UPI0004D1978A|nr:hypothetical protein [endosymbiont of Acanthamoeba sp. UWC8]AIF82042.1 hypothetical protein I862_07440 [endosymbiont of Acanthamoeba sp. UWC8]
MKNNEKHTNQEKPNSKKRVSWAESIEDNEGKTPRLKKKPRIIAQDEEFIQASNILRDYLINKFENGEYEEVKQRWSSYLTKHLKIKELTELYGENSMEVINEGKKIIGKLVCVDNCSILKWIVVNCNIDAFKLISEEASAKYLQRMVRYDDYMAFRLFLKQNRIHEYAHEYNSLICIEGFKLFLKIDNNIINIFWNCLNITDSIKSDFNTALKEMELKQLLDDNKENNSPNHTNSFTQRIFSTAAEATKITR